MVEVWEDLVCPWCYLGRRRLAAAVQAFEHPPAVTVRSRAFELAPRMPRGAGRSVADWLTGWGISTEQVDAKLRGAARAAEADGLQFDMARAVAANTFDGHRLVELGWRTGGAPLQSAVAERLYSAHFCEGVAVDDPEVLVRLGSEAGLEPAVIPGFLAGDDLADAVRRAEDVAAQLGISAVPCFVTDRRLALQGADTTDRLLALLRRAYHEALVDIPVAGGVGLAPATPAARTPAVPVGPANTAGLG